MQSKGCAVFRLSQNMRYRYRKSQQIFLGYPGKPIDNRLYVAYNDTWINAYGGVFQVDEKKTALIFKAFCDENRIRIMKMLRCGEKCACKLLEELNVTQPTLSHHMKILCDSGIVVGRKEGKWMHYSISAEGAKVAADCLKELTSIEGESKNEPCCEK